MTVDEMIKSLQELSAQGFGNIEVVVGEVGNISNIASLHKQDIYPNGHYIKPTKKEVVVLYRKSMSLE